MITPPISAHRRAALGWAGGLAVAALIGAPANASQATEAFIQSNAQAVLNSLAETKSADERRREFAALMDKFADMPRVADFVLGKYSRQLREDPGLYREWQTTFKQYSLAVYEDQLDRYRGRAIKVSPGSQDVTINGKLYSVVKSEIALPNGQPFLVNWRLIQSPDGVWRVVDVALKMDENVIWLAVQQRDDFLAELDRNGGDVRKLIETVKNQTETMRQRVAARKS